MRSVASVECVSSEGDFDARLREAMATVKPLAMCACRHVFEDHKAKAPHRCGECVCSRFVRPRTLRTSRVALERLEAAVKRACVKRRPVRPEEPEVVSCGFVQRLGKRKGHVCGRAVLEGTNACGIHSWRKRDKT